jgi:hypothetical protein
MASEKFCFLQLNRLLFSLCSLRVVDSFLVSVRGSVVFWQRFHNQDQNKPLGKQQKSFIAQSTFLLTILSPTCQEAETEMKLAAVYFDNVL